MFARYKKEVSDLRTAKMTDLVLKFEFEPEPNGRTIEETLNMIDAFTKYISHLKPLTLDGILNVIRALIEIYDNWSTQKQEVVRIDAKFIEVNFANQLIRMMSFYEQNRTRLYKGQGGFLWAYSLHLLLCSLVNLTDISAVFSKINSGSLYENRNFMWAYSLHRLLCSLVNRTDISAIFAKSIVEAGMIPHVVSTITHQPFIAEASKYHQRAREDDGEDSGSETDKTDGSGNDENNGQKDECESDTSSCNSSNSPREEIASIVFSSVTILLNTILHLPEFKQQFREWKILEAIDRFVSDPDEEIRCDATIVLAALTDEDEAAKLEDNGSIQFILKHIKQAQSQERRTSSSGYSVKELIHGLSLIAANDSNKRKIVDKGALPLLVDSLKRGDQEEQERAARTLWTLCFDNYAKDKVRQEPDCVVTLETLSKSEHKPVKKASEGVLWKLRGEEAHTQKQLKDVNQDKHIFISYDWGHADTARRISDKLKSEGHRVWIDVEQMGGSTLDAMAGAVENASVVVMCLSEKYKLSPNCRTEGEYVWQLRKPFVPCMMQRRYRPDGWLGMLLGARLYIDFAKHDFETAYAMLMKELGPHLFAMQPAVHDESDGPVVVRSSEQPVFGALPPSPLTPHTKTTHTPQRASAWTQQQVQNWISICNFKGILSDQLLAFLNSLNGELLSTLCWFKNTTPEYFVNHMTSGYDTNILQLMHLINALNKLP